MNKLAFAIVALALSGFTEAHHSRANFDSETKVNLTGTIVDFSWRNPHVYGEIEVEDSNGETQVWLIEAHSVTAMSRNGWDRNSLKVGEQITLNGSPDRDPSKYFVLMNYVQKADGSKLYAFRNPEAAPVEKNIAASDDFSGTWSLDMRGFNVREAGGGPPAGWSYTELAQQAVDNFSFHQNPELECLPIGVPRISIYPYGTNFFRNGDSLRIHKEHMDEKRVIWFDENARELKNQEPSYVGTSVGRFESEGKLIVESNNFLPTRWGNANGVDSSSEKSVVEEYTLTDDGLSMAIKITITDPVYLNEPAIVTGRYNKDETREFVETACDATAASRHLSVEKD